MNHNITFLHYDDDQVIKINSHLNTTPRNGESFIWNSDNNSVTPAIVKEVGHEINHLEGKIHHYIHIHLAPEE